MSWCSHLLPMLADGQTVQTRPTGNSMVPRINSKDLCTIRPYVMNETLRKGDIVLAKVRGNYYLHLVSGHKPGQVQISNNSGHVNGWTSLANVFGVLTKVEQ